MKLSPRDIESFIKKPHTNICAILLYGPDEGLIRERMNVLTANITSDQMDITDINEGTLSDKNSLLLDEANSISMFGGRKVIRLRSASDKSSSTIKSTLKSLAPDSNLILVEGGELTPRSSLRIMFENAENAVAIPCYVEDERSIGRIIGEALKTASFQASSEVVAYIASNVIGDRGIARSEVEKLITYMGNEKAITMKDAAACVGDSADLAVDDIAKFISLGRFAEADRVLNYNLAEGVSAVSILRNLQSHFMRLHITKSRIEQGENMEGAMKKLQPQVFFKAKDSFEAQVRNWSLSQMETALNVIVSAEAKCKQTANEPATICGRAVLSLSQMGAKALGR